MTMMPLSTIWMPGPQDMRMLAPLWALTGTLVAVLLGALAVGRHWRVSGTIAAIGAGTTLLLAVRGMLDHPGSFAGFAPTTTGPMLVIDQFSYFFIILMSVFLLGVIKMWWLGQLADVPGQPRDAFIKKDAAEFFVLLLGSAIGMTLMVCTTNLLMIILAVESASLPSYGLAGFRKKHRTGAEASLKYVLFGAVTSATMIYGASLLYGQYHTLDVAKIGEAISAQGGNLLMGVSLFAFFVGIAFKVSAVPFHFWCPDVFEGASIEVTTWLSVVSKAAGIGLMLRIVAVLSAAQTSQGVLTSFSQAIAILAAITCTVGNFSAFRQTNLKRLLAFSSIAHAGYMLMAVAIVWKPANNGTNVHPAFSAIVSYLIVYLLMNLCAFYCVAMVYWATGKETLDAYAGLVWRNPAIAVMMSICLFSLIGLPPLGGFMAKWWLLSPLYDANLIWLIFVAVFNTLISLYYYARIIYAMVFVTSNEPPMRMPLAGQLMTAACALAIVLSGTLYVNRLKAFADDRARDLYAVRKDPVLTVPTMAMHEPQQ